VLGSLVSGDKSTQRDNHHGFITANDLEQSVSRVFKTMTPLIKQNETLS
jgi:hypothetical protein